MNSSGSPASDRELLSPDWLLAGFDADREAFQFARVNRQTYADSAFLDHRIRPLPETVRTASLEQVDTLIRATTLPPACYIFHTAFCCSTLLSNCLDHAAQTLVLREPLVLSKLAAALRQASTEETVALAALARRILYLQRRSYAGEPVVVKPSNFANRVMEQESSSDGGPHRWLLMSSSLRSLLRSILKKSQEAGDTLPGFVRALLQDSDYLERAGLAIAAVDNFNLLQQGVLFWHCQRYRMQQFVQAATDPLWLALTMEEFLAQPRLALQQCNDFFELGLSAATLDATITGGAFTRHSKADGPYGAEQQRVESTRLEQRYSGELLAALKWSEPLLRAVPVMPFTPDEDPIGAGF